MTLLPFLLKRSRLQICSYIIFFFWPVTLPALNGSSTVFVYTSHVSPMTFLPFLLNRSRLQICSYNLFLFWPVTLKSVNKKNYKGSIFIKKNSLKKKKNVCMYIDEQNQLKKKKYLCMYIDKQNKKKNQKKNFFFLFCPVTLKTL